MTADNGYPVTDRHPNRLVPLARRQRRARQYQSIARWFAAVGLRDQGELPSHARAPYRRIQTRRYTRWRNGK
jgi:hypothetical protein